jgi:hypothetical protein
MATTMLTPPGETSELTQHASGTGFNAVVIKGEMMATRKQTTAAKKNVRKAAKAAKQQKSLANMPKATKTALGKQGAAVAQRKKTGASKPKTRQELYDEAKRRNPRAVRRWAATSSLEHWDTAEDLRFAPGLVWLASRTPRWELRWSPVTATSLTHPRAHAFCCRAGNRNRTFTARRCRNIQYT